MKNTENITATPETIKPESKQKEHYNVNKSILHFANEIWSEIEILNHRIFDLKNERKQLKKSQKQLEKKIYSKII